MHARKGEVARMHAPRMGGCFDACPRYFFGLTFLPEVAPTVIDRRSLGTLVPVPLDTGRD